MITLRPSETRGAAEHGWLHSRHTFSFGSYYDPAHMGVSALRVINDDHVEPGQGFATHSHQDMEIISYVLQGDIEHKDSMGNIEKLPAGEFQLMSAGTGVTHSEYNPSDRDPLKFLQIWVQPKQLGIEPGYQQKRFPEEQGLQLIASPDARDGSLLIHQDASLYHLRLPAGTAEDYQIAPGRCVYLHVISGEATVAGEQLAPGDGVTVQQETAISILAANDFEALLFDLP
jgi:hypothetical protein